MSRSLFSLMFMCLCGIGIGAVIPQGSSGWKNKSTNNTVSQPSSASCSVDWTFGMDCIEFRINLVRRINKWHGPDNCQKQPTGDYRKGNQNCMYQLIQADDSAVRGIHTSVDGQIVDDFIFRMNPQGYGCGINSVSYSTDLTEVLDNGRNYCNMWNLVQGSGMNDVPKFSRDSSNQRCTQFTTANCNIY